MKIGLQYLCDNRFRALNSSADTASVAWRVENSGDQGTLSLAPSPPGQPFSETVFSTRAIGTVILSAGTTFIASAANQQNACTTQNFPLVQVTVTPATATLIAGKTQQLTADVTGTSDTAVLWSMKESAGGTVDATGLYTAPASAGTFHAIATSHADPTRSATATLTVQPNPVQVALRPATVTVTTTGTQQFTAQVTGTADTAVIWSVREGDAGGTIDATGLYTAPAAGGRFHVVATSHADATRSASATVIVPAPPSTWYQVGHWDPPQPWPLVPIHVVLLHDGRVLVWSRLGIPSLWDPGTNTFEQVPSPSWEFCSGNMLLPDGQVIVPGGHINDGFGLPDVNVFDPSTSTWSTQPPMAAGRWYPTVINLPDGSPVVVAGATSDGNTNLIPEVRNADGTWRQLTGAPLEIEYYPQLFIAPSGRVFMAGQDPHTKYLDTSGAGAWITGPSANWGNRTYGTAVMYEPGKILAAGGGSTPPTATAEVINLNDRAPAWRYTQSMNHARRMVNGTVLPDGKVLITGGTSGVGFNDESHAEYSAELWNPATGKFTELSSMAIFRVYHSIALLMPDARVLVGGGGEGAGGTDERNIEMFSPPYLFNPDGSLATRPGIADAPDSVAYGASFSISSPDAASIAKVALIRNGAVTHSFNASQVYVPLQFSAGTDTLTVTGPSGPIVAPAGPYLLFVVDNHGVPSVARTVFVR